MFLGTGCTFGGSDRLEEALEDLNQVMAESPALESLKKEHIRSLEVACFKAGSYAERLPLARQIVEEFSSYNLDSTLTWIGRWKEWAEAAGLREDALWADFVQGEILSDAGYYMEAYNVLGKEPDLEGLSHQAVTAYFHALYRLADNVEENTLIAEGAIPLHHKTVYADSLLTLYDRSSPEWRAMRVYKLMDQKAFVQARRDNAILLNQLDKDSHDYAKAAFYESVLCDSLGLDSEKLLWEIASARADFKNVVKNYAGLTLVAIDLMGSDINRSFHYIQTSLSDALFFNAKLRPWQISHYLVGIQQAYEQRMLDTNRTLSGLTWSLLLLLLMLIGAAVALLLANRRVSKAKREAEELNSRLQEANGIKENYIGLFLSQLSDKIGKIKSMESHVIKQLRYGKGEQLMKEMIASNAVEKETDAFYDTFDSTFLAMYPDFVNQFNDLLEPEARIIPKKGEKLNTELRIFALMRLGIEDSNAVAELLKYSVRTIYNYKVKIRNAARVPREEFDEMVRKIG